MNVEAMRKIDYWFGIPLCFFLTIIQSVAEIFSGKKRQAEDFSPKKFLLIELSEMGSSILAYPAMRKITRQYPGAELFFLIFEKNRFSVDMLQIVPEKNVVTIRDSSFWAFVVDTIKTIVFFRKQKIDVTFDLELFSRFTAIMTYLTGSQKRVGFYKYTMEGLYRGELFTHKVQYNFQYHISKAFLSFLQIIKTPDKHFPTMEEYQINDEEFALPQITPSEEERKNIWDTLASINPEIREEHILILINPNAGELPVRAWPLENYIRLTQKLLQDEQINVIITGTQNACADAKRICEAVENNARCIDLTTKTTFKELIHLYDISDLLVTGDCGPAHFAALTSIKQLVFFGPESPVLYSPLNHNTIPIFLNFPCSPCLSAFNHRNTICKDNKCLQAITVDEVYRIIKNELK